MKNFKLVNGDESVSNFERVLNGKVTKSRYKLLASYVRRKSFSFNCGCDWDCCGCVFQENYGINISNNQIRITMSQHRNY